MRSSKRHRQSESARGEAALPRRIRVAAERDAWISAAPGRAFEVSLTPRRSEWRIALTEHGREIAVAVGDSWEIALDTALRAARGDRAD
jgi:hypothetical protein